MRFSNTRLNQATTFIIPTLVTLLQLKYQGNTKTPFTTHPLTMTTTVFTAFGYYFACIVQLNTPMKTVGFQKVDISGKFDEGEAPNAPKQSRARHS